MLKSVCEVTLLLSPAASCNTTCSFQNIYLLEVFPFFAQLPKIGKMRFGTEIVNPYK